MPVLGVLSFLGLCCAQFPLRLEGQSGWRGGQGAGQTAPCLPAQPLGAPLLSSL